MKGTFFGLNKGTEVAKRKVEQEDNTETDPAPQSSYSTPSPAKKPRRAPDHHTMSHHPSNLSLSGLSIGEDQDDIPEAILHLEPIQVCGYQTDTVTDKQGNFLGSSTTVELRFYVDQCMEDEDLDVDWADDDTTTTVIIARKYPKVITDLTNNDDFILDANTKQPIYLRTSQMIRTMATNQQKKRKEETTSILSTAKTIGSITFNREMDRDTLDYSIHELSLMDKSSGSVTKSCLAVVVNAKIKRDNRRRTRTKKTRKKVSLSREGESHTIPTATATATATADDADADADADAAADAAANKDDDDAMGVSLNGTTDLPTSGVTVDPNAIDDMSAISGLETPTGNVPGVYDARSEGNRSRGRRNSPRPRRGENQNSGSGDFDRSRSRSRCRSKSREPKNLFIDGKPTEILTGSRNSSAKKRSNDDISQSDY